MCPGDRTVGNHESDERKIKKQIDEKQAEQLINKHKAKGGKGIAIISSVQNSGRVVREEAGRDKRTIMQTVERGREVFIVVNVYAPANGPRNNNAFFEEFTKKYLKYREEVRTKYQGGQIGEKVEEL